MPTYTFTPTTSGTVQISQDGKIISTATPEFAAQKYGYTAPTPAPTPTTTPTTVTPPPSTPSVTPPGTTTLAQDQAKAANQGKPGYDVLGNPIPGYQAPSATTDTTGNATVTPGVVNTGNATIDANTNALIQSQNDLATAAKTFGDTVTGIANGSIPLSGSDLAQVTGLQQQFQTLIDQQTTANKSAVNLGQVRGAQSGAQEYDMAFQAKTINSIASAGAAKIANLQTQEASAVANLTDALKKNDIANIKTAYDAYVQANTATQDAFKTAIDSTQKAIDAATAAQQKVTDGINQVAENAAKNGASPSVLAAITSSMSVGDAIQAAGSSLQNMTGELGDFIATNNYLASQGQPQMTLQQYQDQVDARKIKIAEANAAVTASNKPATQTQITYANYAPRLETADNTITSLTPKVSALPLTSFLLQEKLPSWLQTSDIQSYNQAKTNFINAVLRQESGAAISDTERASYDAQYFPQPGDSPEVIAQKAQNRAQVVSSYKDAAGPAYAPPIGVVMSENETSAQSVLANYAASHPDQSAQMNTDIQTLEKSLGRPATSLEFLQAFPEYSQ